MCVGGSAPQGPNLAAVAQEETVELLRGVALSLSSFNLLKLLLGGFVNLLLDDGTNPQGGSWRKPPGGRGGGQTPGAGALRWRLG